MAHTGLLPTDGLSHGFQHPFLGLDHFWRCWVLGLWASYAKDRRLARQVDRVVFVVYVGRGIARLSRVCSFAYVETAILLSLLAIGGLLVMGRLQLPAAVAAALVAGSALMHGLAHGSEMPATASAYSLFARDGSGHGGIALAGLKPGLLLNRGNAGLLLRVYGGATGLVGAWLLFA